MSTKRTWTDEEIRAVDAEVRQLIKGCDFRDAGIEARRVAIGFVLGARAAAAELREAHKEALEIASRNGDHADELRAERDALKRLVNNCILCRRRRTVGH